MSFGILASRDGSPYPRLQSDGGSLHRASALNGIQVAGNRMTRASVNGGRHFHSAHIHHLRTPGMKWAARRRVQR